MDGVTFLATNILKHVKNVIESNAQGCGVGNKGLVESYMSYVFYIYMSTREPGCVTCWMVMSMHCTSSLRASRPVAIYMSGVINFFVVLCLPAVWCGAWLVALYVCLNGS